MGKHALVAHAGIRCDTDVRAGTDAATAADTRGCWLEVERGDTTETRPCDGDETGVSDLQ